MANPLNYNKLNNRLMIFKALANINRLHILLAIQKSENNELSVGQIHNLLDINQSTISDHLKLLRIQKIVRARQVSTNMFYSISEPLVKQLVSDLD